MLLAAVLPTFRHVSVSARVDATVRQLMAIKDALQRYRLDQGTWPTVLGDLRGSYLPQQAALASPWGTAYAMTPGSPSATLTVVVPVALPPGTQFGFDILASSAPGGTTLTVHVPPSGAASDLQAEKCRVTGVCGN